MAYQREVFEDSMLVAFAGLRASGKDKAGEHLAQKGFMHIALGDLVRIEAHNLGLSNDRYVLIDLANRMRRESGEAVFCLKAFERFSAEKENWPAGLALTGVRAVAEAMAVKSAPGRLIFVEALDAVRHARVKSRSRGDESFGSIEEFLENEKKEYIGGTNNVPAVKPLADVVLANNGSLDEFYARIDEELGLR